MEYSKVQLWNYKIYFTEHYMLLFRVLKRTANKIFKYIAVLTSEFGFNYSNFNAVHQNESTAGSYESCQVWRSMNSKRSIY